MSTNTRKTLKRFQYDFTMDEAGQLTDAISSSSTLPSEDLVCLHELLSLEVKRREECGWVSPKPSQLREQMFALSLKRNGSQ